MTDLTQRSDAYRTVAAALDWLRDHAAERPDLPALAAHVGYSEAHRRSFRPATLFDTID